MKLLATLIFALLFGTFAEAQIAPNVQKNAWLVGGNGSLYAERLNDNQGRLIAIVEPQVGYFIIDNLVFGARIPASFKSTEHEVELTPFIRYYLPISGNILPFAEINGGAGWRWVIDLNDEYSLTKNALFGARSGAAFFLRENISLDLFIYYSSKKGRTEYPDGSFSSESRTKFFGFGVGFLIFL